jgi:hypothetical protein
MLIQDLFKIIVVTLISTAVIITFSQIRMLNTRVNELEIVIKEMGQLLLIKEKLGLREYPATSQQSL